MKKFLLKFSVFLFLLFGSVFCFFYFGYAKQILIDYLQNNKIFLSIGEFNANALTKISINYDNKFFLTASNLQFHQYGFLKIFAIDIDRVEFKKSDNDKNSETVSPQKLDKTFLANILKYMPKISIKNLKVNVQNNLYEIHNIKCAISGKEISINCDIKDKIFLMGNALLDLEKSEAQIICPIDLKKNFPQIPWRENSTESNIVAQIKFNYQELIDENFRAKIFIEKGAEKFCKIDVAKNNEINLHVIGENWTIDSELSQSSDGGLILHKFKLSIPEHGDLQNSHPIKICAPYNCSFDFDFSNLGFLKNVIAKIDEVIVIPSDIKNHIAKISGAISGHIDYQNGEITTSLNAPKIFHENFCAQNLQLFYDAAGTKITCEEISASKAKLSKLECKKTRNDFVCNGHINRKTKFDLCGNIKNDNEITVQKGELRHKKNILKIGPSTFNLANHEFDINADISAEGENGHTEFKFTHNRLHGSFKNFMLSKIAKLFKIEMPEFIINGDVELFSENNQFMGKGNFSTKHLLARKNVFTIDCSLNENGISISALLKNKPSKEKFEHLKVEATLPYFIKNNFEIENFPGRSGKINLTGDANLEHIIELPDKAYLMGKFNCDLQIKAFPGKPNVHGYAKLSNATISIGDVFLNNGEIEVVGAGNSLNVAKAIFKGSKNQTAIAKGSGKIFFDGLMPNLDVYLQLSFNNYFVLHSDDLKVQINGNGAMLGPLNNMKLVGNLDVPYAELSNLSTENSEEKKVIFINDKYLCPDAIAEEGKDFFTYDIALHCKKIKVFGSIFELSLFGDLKLTTYEERGTLIGSLGLKKGHLDMFGKRMLFRRGSVEFLEQFPFSPKANFVCGRDLGNFNVSMTIKNHPVKGGSVELSSTPSASNETIISQILFSKDANELSVGEAAQLAYVAASLNKYGYIFSLLNSFHKIGVIDTISFSTNENQTTLYKDSRNANSAENLTISAGKYIRDKVFISVNKKGDETTFDVDVALSPSVSVKANTGGDLGISWKYRY